MPISLHLIENGTIKDGIDRMLQEVEKNSSKNFVDKDYIDFVTNLITSKLQLVSYICAQNSEITEDERQKYITRNFAVLVVNMVRQVFILTARTTKTRRCRVT